jgi:hypothetical protein
MVHVYAPTGRKCSSTSLGSKASTAPGCAAGWQQQVYIGPDYLERMQADKAGSVVFLSGTTAARRVYHRRDRCGPDVFADKPLCIAAAGFASWSGPSTTPSAKGCCSRHHDRAFQPAVHPAEAARARRGGLRRIERGSPTIPRSSKESVPFLQYVSGQPIRRPTWYFDTAQQGEGLVDVTTH